MREMPRPSWRESEKPPAPLATGASGARVAGSGATVGAAAVGAGVVDRAGTGAAATVGTAGSGAGGGAGGADATGVGRCVGMTGCSLSGTGFGVVLRSGHAFRLALDHETKRVVERVDAVPLHAVEIEDDANGAVGVPADANLPHDVGREAQHRVGERRVASTPRRSKNTRAGPASVSS